MSLQLDVQIQRGPFRLHAQGQFPTGITAIMGVSGAGKTSLLRGIAGLDPSLGPILLEGQDLNRQPVHRRGIGYLSQRGALLPHLTVEQNLRFAQKRGTRPYTEAQSAELIAELDLRPLLARRPQQLSGGEHQRAALARALIGGAQLLLLDEPCAGLDHQAHNAFLSYLRKLCSHHQLTAVMVTHQAWEAARCADFAAEITGQSPHAFLGPVAAINQLLCEGSLATRRDALACLDLPVAGYDANDHLLSLRCGAETIAVPLARPPGTDTQRILITAQSVSLSRAADQPSSALNRITTTLDALIPAAPGEVVARLNTAAGFFLARLTTRSCRTLALHPGDTLIAQIKATALS